MRAATKKLQEPKVPLGLMYHNDPYLNEPNSSEPNDLAKHFGPYINEPKATKVFCITRTKRNNNIPKDVEIENLEVSNGVSVNQTII